MPKNIAKEIYKLFSFQQGERPDLDTMLRYFMTEGLIINNKGDSPVVRSITNFVSFINGNIDAGNIQSINEIEIENSIAQFGKVGHIASRYKLEVKTPSELQTRYGVNLFQVIQVSGAWKISSMCLDDYPDKRLFDIDLGSS